MSDGKRATELKMSGLTLVKDGLMSYIGFVDWLEASEENETVKQKLWNLHACLKEAEHATLIAIWKSYEAMEGKK